MIYFRLFCPTLRLAAVKKNKKVKRKQVSLQEFLGENGTETKQGMVQVTKAIAPSWVEEIEDDDEYDRPLQTFSLPTAPRASRAMDDVPENAPFMAHLSNLPFDVEDEDIYELFAEMEVDSLRLPREDGTNGRSRGFGYIEFKRRNDLIAALSMPDPHIRGRRIRIDISTDADQKRGGRGRYDGDTSNWRKEGGGGRGGDDEEGGRRGYGGFGGGGKEWSTNSTEEGGNWRSNMKQRSDSPPPMRRSNYTSDRGGDREGGDRGGFGRDRYMGRGSGERSDRIERSGIERSDRIERSGIERSAPRDDTAAEPAERPKLNLQKRTLPLPELVVVPLDETVDEHKEEVAKRPDPTPVSAADIFGEAKPVDTSAREREVEERLERERLAREQALDDARKERAAAAEAARAAAEAARAESAAEADMEGVEGTKVNGDDKEAAEAAAPPVVNNWRRKTEDVPSNGNAADAHPRTQSPVRRRFSPDRRGGPRRMGELGELLFIFSGSLQWLLKTLL